MGRREDMVKRAHELMYSPENIRNMGIIAHIDHGKTTLSDNLISGAGLMSSELSGSARELDNYELEAQRGITIFAAAISMVYNHADKDMLINLIDTPGHVDFGGEVTRALRAIDGAIVVTCAVEGCMPQTETVIREALKERVRPVLFINKVDRLINELQLTPEALQQRLLKIIAQVNGYIEKYAAPEYKQKWKVSVQNGTVAFGSAFHNWAISAPFMTKTGISFKDIIDYCNNEKQKELAAKIPAYQVILDMAAQHLPNPVTAQAYRIPHIWHGDKESDIGKSMLNCDKDGKPALIVTKITTDPQAGEIALARLFSGKISRGTKLELLNSKSTGTVQQLAIYMSDQRIAIEDAVAGNIVAISGLRNATSGETASTETIETFESIKHYSEPVITKSIEAKSPKDLPKLIEALRQIAKQDPTVSVQINEETGEHLLSGQGELHLEIIEYMIRNDKKVDIETGPPIIVYRETVNAKSQEVEGKSANKHNKFYLTAEPLPDAIYKAITTGELPNGKPKNPKDLAEKLRALGMEKDEAKKVWDIKNNSMFLDSTKGIQQLHEVKELVLQGFEEAMSSGPLAQEKCDKILIRLHDAKLHEDAIHRGPAQTIPAVKNGILAAMLYANAILFEPKQMLIISVPQEYMGTVTTFVQGKRGQIQEIDQQEDAMTIISKVPIAEMFGSSAEIRSATQGRAMWNTEYLGYEQLPRDLQETIIQQIRSRKGLGTRKAPEDFLA
ncbi:MAG: elongation factor EF-2 [DPANN group archaeon]|nr:elongation factor EF-2 [DPANN group archaeon]